MNNAIDKLAPLLTQVVIDKIKTLQTHWHKPWITNIRRGVVPHNIRGTNYGGGNVLTLLFLCEQKQYKTATFLTFNQAKEENLTILKGAKAFPVYYYFKFVVHKETRKPIKYEDYIALSTEQKKPYSVLPQLKYYNVFNLDQTDCAEKFPERYEQFAKLQEPQSVSDGYESPQLDALLNAQNWHCPIKIIFSDRAYYNWGSDQIVCPEKRQFKEGAKFYGTLLHEMAHSTGHEARLGRKFGHKGTKKYAREELIAELTAALSGISLNVTATLQADNAAYLKHWLNQMKAEPKYLFEILGEVTKAAKLITTKVNGLEDKGEEPNHTATAA